MNQSKRSYNTKTQRVVVIIDLSHKKSKRKRRKEPRTRNDNRYGRRTDNSGKNATLRRKYHRDGKKLGRIDKKGESYELKM